MPEVGHISVMASREQMLILGTRHDDFDQASVEAHVRLGMGAGRFGGSKTQVRAERFCGARRAASAHAIPIDHPLVFARVRGAFKGACAQRGQCDGAAGDKELASIQAHDQALGKGQREAEIKTALPAGSILVGPTSCRRGVTSAETFNARRLIS